MGYWRAIRKVTFWMILALLWGLGGWTSGEIFGMGHYFTNYVSFLYTLDALPCNIH